ncbi:MAG: hypothetical protein OIF48_20590 [Silicimonas sp.]|nr:hypothetical protein [Silicimonas sp.]
MAKIFKTLDGAHLDRALFSARAAEPEEAVDHLAAKLPFFRRFRIGRGDKTVLPGRAMRAKQNRPERRGDRS